MILTFQTCKNINTLFTKKDQPNSKDRKQLSSSLKLKHKCRLVPFFWFSSIQKNNKRKPNKIVICGWGEGLPNIWRRLKCTSQVIANGSVVWGRWWRWCTAAFWRLATLVICLTKILKWKLSSLSIVFSITLCCFDEWKWWIRRRRKKYSMLCGGGWRWWKAGSMENEIETYEGEEEQLFSFFLFYYFCFFWFVEGERGLWWWLKLVWLRESTFMSLCIILSIIFAHFFKWE